MSSKTITIFLIGMLCLCIASAQAAQVHVEPEDQTVSIGENFTVDITVYPEGSDEVFAAQYDLYFNNTLLNATSQTKGPFLSQDGASTYPIVNKINNTLGKTEYGEVRTGVSNGVTTHGVLATITFQAIAEGDGISELRLDKVKISDPGGNPIQANVTSGNVSVRIGICGDVTGDGYVRVSDGIRIIANQTFVGDPQYFVDPWVADVTGDGNVRVSDGIRIIANQTFVGNPDYFLNCG
jgi:hypothetical protein